jgi:hypothetical protein
MMQPMPPPRPLTTAMPITNAFLPTQSTSTSANINTNTNTNTSDGRSISDLLNEIAFGTTSTTNATNTGTSVPIVITGASAGSVAIVTSEHPSSTQSTSTGGIGIVGQQTFTSNDLRWNPERPAFNDGSLYSRLVVFYLQLRDVLTKMLEYMKPMNAGNLLRGVDASAEHAHE